MKKIRMLIAVMMIAIMVPVIGARATEGGYVGYSSSSGTGTTASGESMYDKASTGSSGTDTTANVESVVDKTMTPEAAGTPENGNSDAESMSVPEQEIPSLQDGEEENLPENNGNQTGQMPDDADIQNTEDNTDSNQSAVMPIPEGEIAPELESKVEGIYQANSVEGCAVITESEMISQSYGLASGEQAYAKFLDLDVAKYPVSSRMLDLAAASQGAEICARLNIELGKMAGDKYSLLPSDGAAIQIALGIPSGLVNEGKTYAVACVRKDGTVTILKDQDENQSTITFDTTGGAGVYAIIRY